MVPLQQRAASVDAGDEALGDVSRACSCREIGDDLLPGVLSRRIVQRAVGDDLGVAFAQRHEEEDSTLAVGMGEHAVRELAFCKGMGGGALCLRRRHAQSERSPFERERENGKDRGLDDEGEPQSQMRKGERDDARRDQCDARSPDWWIEAVMVAVGHDDERELRFGARAHRRDGLGDVFAFGGREFASYHEPDAPPPPKSPPPPEKSSSSLLLDDELSSDESWSEELLDDDPPECFVIAPCRSFASRTNQKTSSTGQQMKTIMQAIRINVPTLKVAASSTSDRDGVVSGMSMTLP